MNFAIPTPHVFIFQANLSGPRYESFQSFPPLGVSVTSDSPFCSPKNQGIPPPPKILREEEIWRPLPDEGYRPEILWAGMRWGKTNHPKEVP